MIFQPGDILQDRYHVLRPLGQGGFSQTFTVDDGGTHKVLKVLLENYPKAIDLFQREAKILSQLHHPGIPSVDPDGYFTVEQHSSNDCLHCLVMELIPGVDLRQWLGDRQHQPVTHDQAIDWLQQIVYILATIHQHNCFHRDIKPSNIMLRPTGQLALIDFGAVREVTETYLQKCADDITRTHVYSRGYTPIEQMQGRAVPESDFFALGRTFVHLMTGQNPLDFSTDSHTGRLLWRDHAPQISPALADLMDCLMAPFPGQRPRNPDDIQTALSEIQSNPELESKTEGTVLSKLLHHQTSISSVPDAAVHLLGTLPFEDGGFPPDKTLPPDHELFRLTAGSQPTESPFQSRWRRVLQRLAGWPLIVMYSLVATGSMVGLRMSGLLQPVELLALDALLQARPSELADERMLLITVGEDDLTFQTEAGMVRQGSLADDALFQLLETITPHHPRVIGLDIYREVTAAATPDADQDPTNLASQAYLQDYDELIVVCSVGGGDRDYSAIEPPSTVPLDRVGFSDIPLDPDNHVRRHIIGMAPAEHCDTSSSLSSQLASRYLAQDKIDASMTDQGVLLFGDRPFPALANHTGGYHRGDLGGYELLLNYRQTETIAKTVSLRDVLSGNLGEDLETLVGDRIVLIGTTAPSFGDYHTTPFGEMAGVMIQAHMTSQILSTVLDQRPLLWMWPSWADVLWVWVWSGVSGSVAWTGRSRRGVVIYTGILVIAVSGISYGIMLLGGWMPLIPSTVAIGITILGIRSCKAMLKA